jgi:hypothetical protein
MLSQCIHAKSIIHAQSVYLFPFILFMPGCCIVLDLYAFGLMSSVAGCCGWRKLEPLERGSGLSGAQPRHLERITTLIGTASSQ